jgi:hypothetical protein
MVSSYPSFALFTECSFVGFTTENTFESIEVKEKTSLALLDGAFSSWLKVKSPKSFPFLLVCSSSVAKKSISWVSLEELSI